MHMRRLLASLTVATLLVPGVALAGEHRSIKRNRVDHRAYTTCATCPRSVSIAYDQRSVIELQRKITGTAYSSSGGSLFWFWEKATSWFRNGKFTRKVRWDDGTGFNNGGWNHWEEVKPREYHKDGGPGPPPWRYRRAQFAFKACWPVAGCVLNSHGYVSITARASKTEPFRTGHSNG
jgi:hypothetical protein